MPPPAANRFPLKEFWAEKTIKGISESRAKLSLLGHFFSFNLPLGHAHHIGKKKNSSLFGMTDE